MKRITRADIDDMRARGFDRSTIADASEQLAKCEEADGLIQLVQDAFAGVELEEGIGLQEAAGIDDYAGPSELERLRAADEKVDWRRIPPDTLLRCEAAPGYLDSKGMRFHAPAFLVAELNGTIESDFIERLVSESYQAKELPSLLSSPQREAIKACIRFYAELYPAAFTEAALERAQARFSGIQDA